MKNDEKGVETPKVEVPKADASELETKVSALELINKAKQTVSKTDTIQATIEVVDWISTSVDPEGGVLSVKRSDIVGVKFETNGKKFTRVLNTQRVNPGLLNIGKFAGIVEVYESKEFGFGVASVTPNINKLSINQIMLMNNNAIQV